MIGPAPMIRTECMSVRLGIFEFTIDGLLAIAALRRGGRFENRED